MPNYAAWKGSAGAVRQATLRSRLGQIVTVEHVARRADGTIMRTSTGKATYQAPVAYPTRVEGKVQMVRSASGDERASNTTVLLAGGPPVSAEDRVTLPDGTNPPIIAITTIPVGGETFSTTLFT